MSAVLDTQPELRPMQAEDTVDVMLIEHQVYPFPWTEGIFKDCLRVGYCCWVWQESGQVLGYGVMSVGVGEAHILNLAVHPQHQGRGLGRGMIEHLLQLAVSHGADTAFLEVRPSNERAVELYHGLGFNQVGLRKAYYPLAQGREDALIMARRCRLKGE